MVYPDVKTATIITTDKCTACCAECCFQCSPKNTNILSLKEITEFIDKCNYNFANIKNIIFTGGECTLLGDDLIKAINYAHTLGFGTRVVTNAWWASTNHFAENYIKKLKKAGLDEINYSTGDNHQEFIPFNNIINATKASSNEKLTTVISIESFDEAKFSRYTAFENKTFNKVMSSQNKNYIHILDAVWIPFHNDINYTHKNFSPTYAGCESLLTFIGLFPDKSIRGCCGLTLNYIEAMNLGLLNQINIFKKFNEQYQDFLKIWIYVDGPEAVYDFCINNCSTLNRNSKLIHSCQFCAEIYNNEKIKEVLKNNWEKKVDDVMFRYAIKVNK